MQVIPVCLGISPTSATWRRCSEWLSIFRGNTSRRNEFMKAFWLLGLLALTPLPLSNLRADEAIPSDYFAEPANLPYDEEVQAEKQETGWHWKEFRYTSLVYQGVPIRIHAIYA